MMDALWPYLVVILAGFLPNEVFRVAGVLLGRGVEEGSELFSFIRVLALALLAAVVSKLLYAPPAQLAIVPGLVRVAAVALGVATYFAAGRRLLLGIVAGEALLVGAAWVLGAG